MARLGKIYESFLRGAAFLGALLIFFVFVLIAYDVTIRELGFQPPLLTSAASEFALLYIAMLSAPWLVRQKRHVFVQTLIYAFPRSWRRPVHKLVYLICVLLCLVFTLFALKLGFAAFIRGELEIRSIDIPTWLLHAAMVFGFFFAGLEFIRYLLGFDDMYSSSTEEGL